MATPTLSAPEQGTQAYDQYIADDGYFSEKEVKDYLLNDLHVAADSVDKLAVEFQRQAIKDHKPWALMPEPPGPQEDVKDYLSQVAFIAENLNPDDPLKAELTSQLSILRDETGNLKLNDPRAEAMALSSIMLATAKLAIENAPPNSAIQSAATRLSERETIFQQAVISATRPKEDGGPQPLLLDCTAVADGANIAARMQKLLSSPDQKTPESPIQAYWAGVAKQFDEAQVSIDAGRDPRVGQLCLAYGQQWTLVGHTQLEIKELQNRRQNLDKSDADYSAIDEQLQQKITEKESEVKVQEQTAGLFLDLLQKLIDTTTQAFAKVS